MARGKQISGTKVPRNAKGLCKEKAEEPYVPYVPYVPRETHMSPYVSYVPGHGGTKPFACMYIVWV
jgi:hypothetical protein